MNPITFIRNRTATAICYCILFAITLTVTTDAAAQDRHFARTYESTVLTKGAKDLEFWETWRYGKDHFFSRFDTRFEFEIGLCNRLQTAFYFNLSFTGEENFYYYSIFSPEGYSYFDYSTDVSFSNEWKFKLTDAVANVIGSSVYAEYTLSTSGYEGEAKIILDKRMGDHLLAFNAVGELEYENELKDNNNYGAGIEIELEEKVLEFDLAYMYLFKENFGIGLEAMQKNVFFKNINSGWNNEHSSLFAGPSLFYSGERSFIILNILPQLTTFNSLVLAGSSLDLDEYEKINIRLLVGFGL